MFAVNTLNENREEKKEWAYSKDFFQRALLRRDWYLRREEETISEWGRLLCAEGPARALLSWAQDAWSLDPRLR